jgi:hypothetical protein
MVQWPALLLFFLLVVRTRYYIFLFIPQFVRGLGPFIDPVLILPLFKSLKYKHPHNANNKCDSSKPPCSRRVAEYVGHGMDDFSFWECLESLPGNAAERKKEGKIGYSMHILVWGRGGGAEATCLWHRHIVPDKQGGFIPVMMRVLFVFFCKGYSRATTAPVQQMLKVGPSH